MSYQDLARGRAGVGGPGGAGPRQQPLKTVENQLLKLANSISTLKRQVDVLGTAKDTVAHRHRVADLNTTIQDLARMIKDALSAAHEPSSAPTAPPELQARHKKLLQDFAALLQDYKATQKIAQEREAASLPRPNPGTPQPGGAWDVEAQQGTQLTDLSGGERTALLQAQATRQAAAQQAEIALNEALIEERDTGIRDIVRQIGEVNEMFQDLAVLINDQGEQVRTIDQQIVATAERAKEGQRELVTAERSQRSHRNKCLWFALIAAGVVSLLLVLLFA